PPTCPVTCVTNMATATATAGTTTLSARASAQVCLCTNTACNPLSTCTPPYPFASANPLTGIDFSEREVLRAFTVSVVSNCVRTRIRVFFNDEHALSLGVRRVVVISGGASNAIDYPISLLGSSPDSATNPQVGSTMLTGDQAGTDVSGRPLFPSLFIT